MKYPVLILALLIIFSTPAMACYGEYCSTEVGYIYDFPWKVINKITRPYPTGVISLFDGSFKVENIPLHSQNNNNNNNQNYNFSYQINSGINSSNQLP